MKFTLISKKVKFIVTSLLLLVGLSLQAQNVTFSGKVVNKNQEALPGASINFKDLNKGVATDFDGNFSIQIPKGNHTIEVSFVGFSTIQQEINTNQKNLVFTLVSDDNVLDEVLVAAIRAKANAPVTYSNFTKAEIEKRNLGQDIPILMNYLPSVVTSSDAGAGIGYTYIRVRGSDASRVNVTINGIPYNDAESQGTFWVNMGDFASSTQSLQLQRGVGTSTNGSGAFGASLNILTDAISEEAGGEISNSFGSFGTRKHTVKFTTGKVNDHFELAGRLSNIYSDGYVDRAFTDLKSYFLQGSYVDENTLVKALAFGGKEQTYQAWYGLTAEELATDRRQNPYTYENETDNYQQDHYQLHWNQKINKNLSTNIGLNYTRGKGYFEQFEDDTDEIDEYGGIVVATDSYIDDWGDEIFITDLIRRRWLDNHFYVANFNAEYQKNRLNLMLGISYSNYTNDHYGEVIWAKEFSENANIRDQYYFSDAEKNDLSSFIKATYKVTDKLTAYADIQGRHVDYRTGGITSDIVPIDVNTTFNFFNPKAGLSYNLNNANNFYLSYARANREPNRSDFEVGTTQHETLDDYELGWRLNTKNVKLNTNLYYMNYTNQLVLTGAINDVGEAIRATSGKSYRAGIELDADIKATDFLTFKPNVALSINENTDFNSQINGELVNLGNTPISFSPNVIIGNAIIASPLKNLQLSLLSKYVGEQYMGNLGGAIENEPWIIYDEISTDNEKLKGYFTSDFNVNYTIEMNKIFKSIVLSGLVNNVFNTKYVANGYYYTYDDYWSQEGVTTTIDGAGYYPQATINFLLGATLKF